LNIDQYSIDEVHS